MSSEKKHTPGPWEDAEYPVVFAPYPKDSVAMVEVANCMLDRDIFDQWQANARLIAAAPDLLGIAERTAALLRMSGYSPIAGSDNPAISLLHDAMAAIARATGQEG